MLYVSRVPFYGGDSEPTAFTKQKETGIPDFYAITDTTSWEETFLHRNDIEKAFGGRKIRGIDSNGIRLVTNKEVINIFRTMSRVATGEGDIHFITSGNYAFQFTDNIVEDLYTCVRVFKYKHRGGLLASKSDNSVLKIPPIFWNITVSASDNEDDILDEVKRLVFPSSVLQLGPLPEMPNVKKIELPERVRNLTGFTFARCPSLEEVGISKTQIQGMGDYCFYGCQGLQRIELPETIERITLYALSSCGLKYVKIPELGYRIKDLALDKLLSFNGEALPFGCVLLVSQADIVFAPHLCNYDNVNFY